MSGLTVDAVYEYMDGVCFKTGPPGKVGVETEWLVVDPEEPAGHVPVDRVRALMAAAGPPPAGSRLTFEPGGQLELSSPPLPGPAAACAAMRADLRHAQRHLGTGGVTLSGWGVDPRRPPRLQETADRYRCMFAYFGVAGLAMMCTTASVQVCLDVGADRADAERRWRLAHAIGPMLVAAFANSPLQTGRPTGLRSTRQAIWAGLDPGRTRPVPHDRLDPAAAWAGYALDARVMLRRDPRDGWTADPGMTFRDWLARGEPAGPTVEDLGYHLSTLFPPVRPRGWLELRMIDALPEPYWQVPVAVAAALLDDPAAADIAAAAAEPCAGRWAEAARDALTDPLLRRAAGTCFAAAHAALLRRGEADLGGLVADYAQRYVERGRCPADDVLDPLTRVPAPAPHSIRKDLSWLSTT
jgi:glutamate--cysteine ligase